MRWEVESTIRGYQARGGERREEHTNATEQKLNLALGCIFKKNKSRMVISMYTNRPYFTAPALHLTSSSASVQAAPLPPPSPPLAVAVIGPAACGIGYPSTKQWHHRWGNLHDLACGVWWPHYELKHWMQTHNMKYWLLIGCKALKQNRTCYQHKNEA